MNLFGHQGRHTIKRIETLAQGRWLSLQKVYYIDKQGLERTWERCVRVPPELRSVPGETSVTTADCSDASLVCQRDVSGVYGKTSNGFKADAAIVVPLLFRSSRIGAELDMSSISVALVKQFRPPLAAYTLEFPAGLVDANEAPVDAALRELKEETGLIAKKVVHISPPLSLSPGVGTESSVIVVSLVDLDSPMNQNPQQHLDESEDITVIHFPLNNLTRELQKASADGVVVFDGVYYVALSVSLCGTMLTDCFKS